MHITRVLTDHNNLKYFMSMKNLSDYQARAAEELSQYNFDIEYKPGPTNPSDPLSRRPDYTRGYEEMSGKHISLNAMLLTLQQKLRVASLRGDLLGTTLPTLRNTCKIHANMLCSGTDELSAQLNYIHTDRQHLISAQGSEQDANSLNEYVNSMRYACLIAESKWSTTYVLRQAARVAAVAKMAFEEEPPAQLLDFIHIVQQRDIKARSIVQQLEQGELPAGVRVQDYSLDNDNILQRDRKVYVPRCIPLRDKILKRNHDNLVAGHYGIARMTEII
jgi:hypothetical protein